MNDFRLIAVPAIELDSSEFIESKYETKAEAVAAMDAMANLLLFLQDDLTIMKDYSNAIYVDQYIDGEWVELEESE